ncbi:MAG TPA: hypothetical protein VMZ50_10480 [Phycisphaerae bacterium]|nr:hypothetical protein [Phycisphaerae bacterium]
MICPQCRAEGRRSTVTAGAGSMTSAYYPPFYDEDGKHHVHDANGGSQEFTCSNGHRWRESTGPAPCWCGWPEKAVRADA